MAIFEAKLQGLEGQKSRKKLPTSTSKSSVRPTPRKEKLRQAEPPGKTGRSPKHGDPKKCTAFPPTLAQKWIASAERRHTSGSLAWQGGKRACVGLRGAKFSQPSMQNKAKTTPKTREPNPEHKSKSSFPKTLPHKKLRRRELPQNKAKKERTLSWQFSRPNYREFEGQKSRKKTSPHPLPKVQSGLPPEKKN